MAVMDDFGQRETESLVLLGKTFYPLSIHVTHYQLRHYISSFEQDLIHYADQEHVYSLNVRTKRRSLVTTLPFESRCTSSGFGWICVGGETEGHFAAIKLDDNLASLPNEVDSSLPLDLGPGAVRRHEEVRPKPKIHLQRVGEQIVNSISIHRLPGQGPDGEDDIVAVLTNNDKTVRIYSLSRYTQVVELQCPFAMNHATISPDGSLLVAVGDLQKAFFYQRRKASDIDESRKTQGFGVEQDLLQWTEVGQVNLHCPLEKKDIGYFTTAWSPTGTMCAVGSEGGYITIFDVGLLLATNFSEDAAIQTVKSSRADGGHGPGSVRTMLFTKQPWDLLIWTEDQGRVCALDLRHGTMDRQVIHLDSNGKGVERVDIIDVEGEHNPDLQDLNREIDYLRRFRRALDAEGNGSSLHYGEAPSELRRLTSHAALVESDNDPYGLTPQEEQIIQALRVTREQASNTDSIITPRSINYHTSGSGSTPARSTEYTGWNRGSSNQNFGHNLLSLGMLRDSLRDRYSDSSRPPHLPRLSSVFTFSDDASSANPRPTPSTSQQRPERGASPSSLGWPLVGAALIDRARDTSSRPWIEFASTTQLRQLRQLNRERERLRARELESHTRYGLQSPTPGAQHDQAFGVRTAGLAASDDGRDIYVGVEDGIYILSVDTLARKMFPAMSLR